MILASNLSIFPKRESLSMENFLMHIGKIFPENSLQRAWAPKNSDPMILIFKEWDDKDKPRLEDLIPADWEGLILLVYKADQWREMSLGASKGGFNLTEDLVKVFDVIQPSTSTNAYERFKQRGS